MTESPRKGGPRRLDDETARSFLSSLGSGSVCFEDSEGRLCATPVNLRVSSETALDLIAPDIQELVKATERGGPACFVGDEFETYEGIKGVIVRGNLASGEGPAPRVKLLIASIVGFSFAGTLPARFTSAASGDNKSEATP